MNNTVLGKIYVQVYKKFIRYIMKNMEKVSVMPSEAWMGLLVQPISPFTESSWSSCLLTTDQPGRLAYACPSCWVRLPSTHTQDSCSGASALHPGLFFPGSLTSPKMLIPKSSASHCLSPLWSRPPIW